LLFLRISLERWGRLAVMALISGENEEFSNEIRKND